MADPRFDDLCDRLILARIAERREQLPLEIASIRATAAKTGNFRSGGYFLQIHRMVTRELEIRSVLVWESLVRVHQTLGGCFQDHLAPELKAHFGRYIEQFTAELSDLLVKHIDDDKLRERLTITEAKDNSYKKHEIEIDLYSESLRQREAATKQGAPMSQNYTFYGSVGAVQTGANAMAHVVQGLTAEDRQALIGALAQVREALLSAEPVGRRQKELLEVADEATAIVSSPESNSTKLRAYLDVLSAAVQGISNAQPAYRALKTALLPLGIMLP